jgi:hypothetical protein
VMLTLVKGDQEILHLKEHQRGQCLETSQEVAHIDTKIEKVEEDPMETSDDESADDETYKMSLVPPSENSSEDDVESIESELRRQVEEEEQEEMVEGTLNPRSRGRVPFNPSPTIRRPHKPLSYHVTSYRGKGTTKQVKRLRKIDPKITAKECF